METDHKRNIDSAKERPEKTDEDLESDEKSFNKISEEEFYHSTKPEIGVKLRLSSDEFEGEGKDVAEMAPISIPSFFKSVVKKYPQKIALAHKPKTQDNWINITYLEYLHLIQNASKGFIKLGVSVYDGVSIIGFNSPEWFISDMAAIFSGCLAVGIYTTNSPEACHYVISHSNSTIVVVEDNVQLDKILQIRDRLPQLKAIIIYAEEPREAYTDVYTWDSLIKLGESEPDTELNLRLDNVCINKACVLVYTSGTTGNPKGVMLNHDNIMWTCHSFARFAKISSTNQRIVSYLPLSHIAGQILDLYMGFYLGATTYFAQPDALKGTLVKTITEVRPTMFLGVPRVWEKIEERLSTVIKETVGLKKKIFDWACELGLRGTNCIRKGEPVPYGWWLANLLVFDKIKKSLGFDQCSMFITGAAPISIETINFFNSLNIQLRELYGMSEVTGPQTISLYDDFYTGSVGKDMYGTQTMLHNQDSSGEGEVCMKGRNVFMGYFKEEEKTEEVLDSSGWLHSGDLGRKEDGFLFLTGRIKELLITAGGENIAPVPIETRLKNTLNCISNCMLIGDKRKFLSVLIAFKTTIDPNSGLPKDELTDETITWLKTHDIEAKTVTELKDTNNNKENLSTAVQAVIDEVNNHSVSRAQKIQKWALLPRDFSLPGGELGPSLKLRRPIVLKMYADLIDSLYDV